MNNASESAAEAKLVRAIGVPALAANIVNTTIGASIFVLPGTMAKMLGHAAPIAFLVCAIAQGIFVTCFALAGSRVSMTGGLYAYVEVAFGRYVGFLAGLTNFITNILGVAAVANVLVDAVSAMSPGLATNFARIVVMLLIFVTLVAINVRSVRAGASVVTFVTLVKLIPLLLFIAVGISYIKPHSIALTTPADSRSLGDAVLLLMFAFFGIEGALTPSGEVRNPARTVPRAIYIAICLTTLVYLLIQFVAQGALGARLAENTASPLAEAASVFLGNFGRMLLLVGAAISSFGYITSDILSSPRTLFAFGRDGILPGWFAHVHPRFRSPDFAIIVYASISFALAISSSFESLAIISNVAALLLYMMCCAAAWELLRRDVRTDGAAFSFPGASVVPFIAIAFIIWMLMHATRKEFITLGSMLLIGSGLYFLRAVLRRSASPSHNIL
jgi:amino acid transporter